MKDSRRSSSTYTESLFLHLVKYNLLFLFQFCFFFYLGFFLRIFTIHRTADEVGDYLLISVLSLQPALQTLRHQLGYCRRELTFAHGWQPESNMESLVHVLQNSLFSTLALVSAVVRRMLKTWVTLGNISRVLLNLTKILIFAMFKDSSSSLPMFTHLTVIFSLQFTNYGCLSS